MLLVILIVKRLLERFTKKNCKKTNQKEFRVEKVIKRKGNKLYVNGKATIVLLIVGLIKKTWYQIVNIFLDQNLCGEMWKLN